MHVLTLTSLFPSSVQPVHAVFVRNRMENFTRKYGHDWTVVAPVPWFPRLPVKVSQAYDAYARVPSYEEPWGYPLYHPRYLVTPKAGMRWYGAWMAAGVRRTVRAIHARKPIDVIDGHFVYPDGSAATALGRELGVPVVLSARGTDLNLYPSLPPIVPLLKRNLEACRHLVCVCSELRTEALKLGVPPDKASVIGNGVDAALFGPGDAAAARRARGLSPESRVFLSVGHLTERKGFHLVLEAFASLKDPGAVLVLVGEGPQRSDLEALRDRLGLGNRVILAGAVLNRDLPGWYHAADIFVLASSREGWPNVVSEAQACGLPVVATNVAGIPDIVTDDSLGLLVGERTAPSLRDAMAKASATAWDRDAIARKGRARTWDAVSEELRRVFDSVAAAGKPSRT